jgi:hypothetical protein
LVSLVDIAATFASPTHGVSLLGAPRESLFAYGRLAQPGEWRLLLRGFDKLVTNARGEVTALFNLALDPEESVNLASSNSHALLRDELLAHLRLWQRRLAYLIDPSGLKRR